MITVHATAISIKGYGILLRGPSGSGKSDLALRLMDEGADLIADDYVELHAKEHHINVIAPDATAGMMEMRGFGLIKRPFVSNIPLSYICDLVPSDYIVRLPEEPCQLFVDDIAVPLFRLDGRNASAPARVRMMLDAIITNSTASKAKEGNSND